MDKTSNFKPIRPSNQEFLKEPYIGMSFEEILELVKKSDDTSLNMEKVARIKEEIHNHTYQVDIDTVGEKFFEFLCQEK